ncbi:hypothetical protein DYQ86_16005 [Acidobacteria bacterium AB60]|nr:hypothetical protein DYQ86_16005 [Acidobacteria bacterium AB60]
MGTSAQGVQFLRAFSLILSNQSVGLDVSQQRIRFEVRSADTETPNTLQARIYNLSKDSVNTLWAQATYAQLSAGYVNGPMGAIFQGDIVQMRQGSEDNQNTYIDVFAADGDLAYNNAIHSSSSPAGTTDAQELASIAKSMNLPVDPNATDGLTTGGILPRGKTLFGMGRDMMRALANRNNCRWSIQNGVLTLIPNDGYLPGQAVVINSQTGMIGVPEQTENGVFVRCLLNPLIKIGGLIQLNSADIAQSSNNGVIIGGPSYRSTYYGATITPGAGLYRVMVAEHVGDSRGSGDSWISELTCLAVDKSAQNGQPQVNPA